MPPTPEKEARRQEVLAAISTGAHANDPSVIAITQLLSASVDDTQIDHAITGAAMIYQLKRKEIDAVIATIAPPPAV